MGDPPPDGSTLGAPTVSIAHPTSELVDVNDATREVIALSGSDLQRDQVILRQEFAGAIRRPSPTITSSGTRIGTALRMGQMQGM